MKKENTDDFMTYEKDFKEKYDIFSMSSPKKEIKQEFGDGSTEIKSEIKQEDSNSQGNLNTNCLACMMLIIGVHYFQSVRKYLSQMSGAVYSNGIVIFTF